MKNNSEEGNLSFRPRQLDSAMCNRPTQKNATQDTSMRNEFCTDYETQQTIKHKRQKEKNVWGGAFHGGQICLEA